MIVRKKKFSFYTGLLTFCLALAWVGLVVVGFVLESKKRDVRDFREQRVVLSLEPLQADISKIAETKYISIVIDDDENLDVHKVYSSIPLNVTFGLSVYNKNIQRNISFLNSQKKPFLVKLPLRNTASIRSLDISLIDPLEIKTKIDDINFTGACGFYNLGDDGFVSHLAGLNAVVDKITQYRSKIFYGIENKTLLLEMANNTSTKLSAFDFLIDATHPAEFLVQLQALENASISKRIPIAVVKINESTVEILDSWYNYAKDKGLEIIPIS